MCACQCTFLAQVQGLCTGISIMPGMRKQQMIKDAQQVGTWYECFSAKPFFGYLTHKVVMVVCVEGVPAGTCIMIGYCGHTCPQLLSGR